MKDQLCMKCNKRFEYLLPSELTRVLNSDETLKGYLCPDCTYTENGPSRTWKNGWFKSKKNKAIKIPAIDPDELLDAFLDDVDKEMLEMQENGQKNEQNELNQNSEGT